MHQRDLLVYNHIIKRNFYRSNKMSFLQNTKNMHYKKIKAVAIDNDEESFRGFSIFLQ